MGRLSAERRAGSTRRWRWVFTGLVALYLLSVGATSVTVLVGAGPVDGVAGPAMSVFSAVAAALAVRAARHPGLDRRSRRAWGSMGAAFVVLLAAYLSFAVTSNGPDPNAFPTVGDGLRLLFVPILLVGLLRLPNRIPTAEERYKMALDIGMILAGGAMLLWYLVIGPVLQHQHSTLVTLVATAYPITDLALIAGATLVMIRTASSSSRRPALLIAGAIFLTVVGDVYLSYQRAHTADSVYLGWQFLCWQTSCFVLALAAAEQCRRAGDHEVNNDTERAVRPVPYLPYTVVAVGYGLLLLVSLDLPLFPYGGLAIGAVTTTALVVLRQIVALRDNYRLAAIDALTGLANRALLHDRLGRAVERSQRTGTPVAVLLIDLDDFKTVNDTFGHEAGDRMLVAVAGILTAAVRAADTVARLGGDEFAIVLAAHGGPVDADGVAARIHAAMQTPVFLNGQPVLPRASIGTAVLQPGRDTAGDLLHRADTEMYRRKRAEVAAPALAVTPDPLTVPG